MACNFCLRQWFSTGLTRHTSVSCDDSSYHFFTLSSILASRGAANYWYFRPRVPRGKTCWEPLGLRLYLSYPSNVNPTLYLGNVCYHWWSFKFSSAYLRYTLFYYIANYYWQARIKVKFQHEDKIYFLQKVKQLNISLKKWIFFDIISDFLIHVDKPIYFNYPLSIA